MNDDVSKNRQWIPPIQFTGNPIIDGTLVIALASIVGYGAVFYFEKGYCSYFGIPNEFIKIELLKLAYVPSVFFGLFLALNLILILLEPFRKLLKFHPRVWRELFWATFFVIFGIFGWWSSGNFWICFPNLVLAAFILTFPILVGGKGKSYAEKLLAVDEVDYHPSRLDMRLWSSLGRRGYVIYIFAFLAVFLSEQLGRGIARHKTDFLELRFVDVIDVNAKSPYIVLAKFGNNYVFVEIDSLNTIGTEFHLINEDMISNNPTISIAETIIDQLKIPGVTLNEAHPNSQQNDRDTTVIPDSIPVLPTASTERESRSMGSSEDKGKGED